MPAARRAQEARRAVEASKPLLPPVWGIDSRATAEALADEIFGENRPTRSSSLRLRVAESSRVIAWISPSQRQFL